MIKLIDNSSFEFNSPLLNDLNLLNYVDINVKHNCCVEQEQRLTIAPTGDSRLCTADYCNYSGQDESCGDKFPDNCPNPQGSYYFKLSELAMYINGTTTNILDRTYNLTQTSEVSILTAYLKSRLPEDTVFTIEVTYNELDYLCVRFNFIDLPSGVRPVTFTLRNSDTCYVSEEFKCLDVIPNTTCTLDGIKLLHNKYYVFKKLRLSNDVEITVNEVVDLITEIEEVEGILDVLTDLFNASVLLTHNVTLGVSVNASDIYITAPKNILGLQVKSIFGTLDGIDVELSLECIQYDTVPVQNIYSTKVIVSTSDTYNGIYAFNVINPDYLAPINLLTTPLLLTDILTLPDILALVDETIDIEVTAISGGYEIVVNSSEFVPYDIVLHDNYSNYKVFAFGSKDLINISSNYNPNLVEYIHNNLYIKSQFFGATDKLDDGMYSININIVTSTNIYSYKYCIFVFKNVCVLSELYNVDKDKGRKAVLLKELIEDSVNCGCDCEQACLYYSELSDLLYNKNC